MKSISRILYKGDQVYWDHSEHGTVPCTVIQNEDGLNPKIRVQADLPDQKHVARRWVMKVRLMEDDE